MRSGAVQRSSQGHRTCAPCGFEPGRLNRKSMEAPKAKCIGKY